MILVSQNKAAVGRTKMKEVKKDDVKRKNIEKKSTKAKYKTQNSNLDDDLPIYLYLKMCKEKQTKNKEVLDVLSKNIKENKKPKKKPRQTKVSKEKEKDRTPIIKISNPKNRKEKCTYNYSDYGGSYKEETDKRYCKDRV